MIRSGLYRLEQGELQIRESSIKISRVRTHWRTIPPEAPQSNRRRELKQPREGSRSRDQAVDTRFRSASSGVLPNSRLESRRLGANDCVCSVITASTHHDNGPAGDPQTAPVKDDSTQTVSSDPERNSFLRHQHSIDDQKRIALDVRSGQIKPNKNGLPRQGQRTNQKAINGT